MKALRAVLCQPNVPFELLCTEYDHPFGRGYPLKRDGAGYRSYSQPLGLGTWHMALVSKRPGLMLSADEESVWRELSGPRFTTPILRSWMPYLLGKLTEGYRDAAGIRNADAWGCKPGVLAVTNETLDDYVTEGLKSGTITI